MDSKSHKVKSGSGMEAAKVAAVLRVFLGQAEECPVLPLPRGVSLVLNSHFRMGLTKQRQERNNVHH